MYKLNWFKNKVVSALLRFDVNKALKNMYQLGKQVGMEQERKNKPDCLICPLYLKTHPREISAYEPPSPTTEGKIEAQRPDLPDWWKRRNPHLVTTELLPKARPTRKLTPSHDSH